jgi:ADP-ribose pyrophosphatase YjhB (NUDIX family)
MAETVKRSVSLAIHGGGGRVLLVQRPPEDEDLPLAWGLPAASLRDGERWEDAVRRAARDKLGVVVDPGPVLNAGSLDREGYRLEMRLYEAGLVGGSPSVPREASDVTQYVAWRWGDPVDLGPAAEAGSLCSRLYLDRRAAGGPGRDESSSPGGE